MDIDILFGIHGGGIYEIPVAQSIINDWSTKAMRGRMPSIVAVVLRYWHDLYQLITQIKAQMQLAQIEHIDENDAYS